MDRNVDVTLVCDQSGQPPYFSPQGEVSSLNYVSNDSRQKSFFNSLFDSGKSTYYMYSQQRYYDSNLLITIYVAVSFTCCFLDFSNINPGKLAYIVTFYAIIVHVHFHATQFSFWSLDIYKIKIGSRSICQFISFS